MPGTRASEGGEELRVPATDGFALGATWFAPAEALRGVVVIAGATGVPRRYYSRFAAFLARGGLTALTFDYRGVGGSRPASLRGFEAHLHEWGERDLAGALAHATARAAGAPVLVIGHSVGGQVLGLAAGAERARAVLTVASQSGYWRLWPGRRAWTMALYWYLLIPGAARLIGHLPMSLVGGEDLPRGVALEWARWSRDPRYVMTHAEARGATGYAAVAAPWRAYAISDDAFAPRAAVERLLTCYPAARTELRLVAPRDVGARAIGHFGFFRPPFEATLWTEARGWLLDQASRGD